MMTVPILKNPSIAGDLRSIAAILYDWFFIGAAIWLSEELAKNPLVYLFSVLVIGNRLYALSLLLHDATHFSLLRKPQWNKNLQWLFGWSQLQTFDQYLQTHMKHHNFLGEPQDPTNTILNFYLKGDSATLFRVCFRPFLGLQVAGILSDYYSNCRYNSKFRKFFFTFLFTIIILSTWLGICKAILLYWIVPLLFIYPVFVFWGEFMDHWQTKSLVRTTQFPFLFQIIFYPHNSCYHSTHHRHPQIPWYLLPQKFKNEVSQIETVSIIQLLKKVSNENRSYL